MFSKWFFIFSLLIYYRLKLGWTHCHEVYYGLFYSYALFGCTQPLIFGHVQRYCISLTENFWRNTINKLHCKMVIDGTGQKNNDNQLYVLTENLIWGLLLFLKKKKEMKLSIHVDFQILAVIFHCYFHEWIPVLQFSLCNCWGFFFPMFS